jgi:hypothetical protein
LDNVRNEDTNLTLSVNKLYDTFEVASNAHLNSNSESFYGVVFLGENNILYLMMLFEWISASFALFYIDVTSIGKWAPLILTSITILWNCVLLLIILFVGLNGNAWNVPVNNAILGSVLLISTVIVHVM